MTTKFIPLQAAVSGVFHVVDAIYLKAGHSFETSPAIETELATAEIEFTDPPYVPTAGSPTGRVRVFKDDMSHILVIASPPTHIESNVFFTPTVDELAAITADYGYEAELGTQDVCAINEQLFPSVYFNSDDGLISSSNIDPLDGTWSTEGDGTSLWTPNAPIVEGLYEVEGVLETMGRDLYVTIGGTGPAVLRAMTDPNVTERAVVREPTSNTIRVHEGDGLPVAADSLFVRRIS